MAKFVSAEAITRTERYRQAVHFYDRWQRRFLLLGAFYDALFGVLVYFFPTQTTTFFHLLVPPEGVGSLWLRLDGIFLIIVPLFYLLAAADPDRYLGIVLVCIFGKAWSVGFYLHYVFWLGAPPMFLTYAILDTIFFFLHIWALGPDRMRRVRNSLRSADLYP
jgi:hypothetical protein